MKNTIENLATYVIATKDGKVLEVADFSRENGGGVRIWARTDESGDTQQWVLEKVVEDYYKFTNRFSGKVLDVVMQGAENGAWLHQWDYIGADSQEWKVEPAARGLFKNRNQVSGQ